MGLFTSGSRSSSVSITLCIVSQQHRRQYKNPSSSVNPPSSYAEGSGGQAYATYRPLATPELLCRRAYADFIKIATEICI